MVIQTQENQSIFDSLHQAFVREEPVVLSPQGIPVSFFTTIAELEERKITVRNPILAHMLPYVLNAPSFGLFCRMHWIHVPRLKPVGLFIQFEVTGEYKSGEARQSVRLAFSHKDDAFVEIVHPFDPQTVLKRKIFDLSDAGMSFRAREITPLLQPGRMLPSCRIWVRGQLQENRAGTVLYVKRIIELSGEQYIQVGVKFLESTQLSSKAHL